MYAYYLLRVLFMNNMLIKTILTGLISASLLLSPAAFAGHHNNSHNNSDKHHSKKSHHKHYKKNKRRHNYTGEIIGGIIGGVVLGTILSDSSRNTHVTTSYNKKKYNHNQYSHRHNNRYNGRYNNHPHYNTANYQQPIRVNKTIIVNNTPTQTYRVLNGSDCYLVNHNNNGNEILTQVPSVNCGF